MAVERKGFFCYNSWLRAIEPYAYAERGRIFTALLLYSSTGKMAEFSGNERFLLPTLFDQIDRDTEKAAKISKTQRANQAKPQPTPLNSPQLPSTPLKIKTRTRTWTRSWTRSWTRTRARWISPLTPPEGGQKEKQKKSKKEKFGAFAEADRGGGGNHGAVDPATAPGGWPSGQRIREVD